MNSPASGGPPGPASPLPGGGPGRQLAGLRVGVTAGRRGAELVDALTRLGARVLWAPTVVAVPVPAAALERQTMEVLAADPVWVVVTTAESLDRWVHGAGAVRADILALLARARVAARGAKAVAACHRHGVAAPLTSPTARGVDLVGRVAGRAEAGDQVLVVADGNESPDVVAELGAADLVVHLVAPYRWGVPAAAGTVPGQRLPAGELVRALCAGEVDALAFTSPPSVDGLFAVAASLGREMALRDVLSSAGNGRVLVAAIGPATAEALEQRHITVGVCPLQPRIPALANALAAAPIAFRSFGRQQPLVIDPRTRSVTGPGGAVELSDLQFSLLASLARRPGMTCPISVLLRELSGEGSATAPGARRRLEVLASRLRARLVPIEVNLATVRKRGYRLELRCNSVNTPC
jgi:uroporphyrinogen-III synthase